MSPPARIECGRSFSVSDPEQKNWQDMLARTGLRAPDVMRRALRIANAIDRAMERGATIKIVESDGTTSELLLV